MIRRIWPGPGYRTLPGGLLLLVGRDMHEIDQASRRIRLALAWSIGLTLVLAVAGALAMSRGTMRRIDAINRASREIMHGDLARRIPTRGTRDDFDQLAEQLNAMLDRIQELMDGIRRVTDDIAHDLKTPLTRLRTRLEELRESGGLGLGSAESVEAAIEESDRLLATFAALLRIARVESTAGMEGFVPVDLGALARDAVELYEPYAQEHGRRIAFLGEAGELPGVGDRDLLFQALSNLVDNAIRHGRGRVVVEAGRAPGGGTRGRIVVRDEGPGIPAADRERVFRRFVRLEAAGTRPERPWARPRRGRLGPARRHRGARGERGIARRPRASRDPLPSFRLIPDAVPARLCLNQLSWRVRQRGSRAQALR